MCFCHFRITSKFTDHVIAAKCPYDEIPGIFKCGNPFSDKRERERGEKEILIFLYQFVYEHR